MFLVELIASSFLDLISKQAGPDAAVSAFLLWQEYTSQLCLRYKREIFILGVLGFLKTTRSFPNIREEVQSLPKMSEVFRRRPKSAEGEVIEKTLIHKIRDRE